MLLWEQYSSVKLGQCKCLKDVIWLNEHLRLVKLGQCKCSNDVIRLFLHSRLVKLGQCKCSNDVIWLTPQHSVVKLGALSPLKEVRLHDEQSNSVTSFNSESQPIKEFLVNLYVIYSQYWVEQS